MSSSLSIKDVEFPSALNERIALIPENLLEMSFPEIEKKANPDIDLKRMRVAFWLEYDRAYRTQTSFNLTNVYKGIMTGQHFNRLVMGNTYRLLYMISVLPSYKVIMEEMLHYGLMLEREIMELPHITGGEGGKPRFVDVKLLALKQKITEGVHNRLKGLPVSRTLMLTKDMDKDKESDAQPAIKDVENQIEQLKKELGN